MTGFISRQLVFQMLTLFSEFRLIGLLQCLWEFSDQTWYPLLCAGPRLSWGRYVPRLEVLTWARDQPTPPSPKVTIPIHFAPNPNRGFHKQQAYYSYLKSFCNLPKVFKMHKGNLELDEMNVAHLSLYTPCYKVSLCVTFSCPNSSIHFRLPQVKRTKWLKELNQLSTKLEFLLTITCILISKFIKNFVLSITFSGRSREI